MNGEWWKGTMSLIAAFAALLGGLAMWWPLFKGIRRIPRRTAWIGLVLLCVASAIFATRIISKTNIPLNSKLTTRAWDALNHEDYKGAAATADECIRQFRGEADRQEAALEKDRLPPPGIGRVSEQEKKAILERGVLNDVATCFFIRGEAASKSGETEDAEHAYRAVLRYGYARTFDPQGFFWSPAEVAAERLVEPRTF